MNRLLMLLTVWAALPAAVLADPQVLPIDLDQVRARAQAHPEVVAPGIAFRADLGLSGLWADDGGWSTWTYAVQVPGTESLAFHAKVTLPTTARLHVAGGDGAEVKVYDAYNTVTTGNEIWSVLVPGDTLRLSVVVPTSDKGATNLAIDTLFVGVRPSPLAPRMSMSPVPNATTAPSQVNWECDRSSANEQAGDATVMYTVQASNLEGNGPALAQCTGTLMNDVPQDGKLHMLSAAHCGQSNFDPSTITVYWNRVSSCSAGLVSAQSVPGPTTSGGTNEAVFATGGINKEDQWLILLSGSGVPAGSDAVYSGWDASNVFTQTGGGPSNVFGINHSSGETKQYTASTNGPSYSVSPNLNYTLSTGETLPGASGSGTFEKNQELFATLSGGGGDQVSLMALSAGWKGDGGTNNPASAIGAWLDPNSTGTLQMSYMVPPTAPTVTISVNPTQVIEGTSYMLTWSGTNAMSCTASGAWSGPQAVQGSTTQSQTTSGSFNYVLTCSGAGGTTAANAVEVVNPRSGGSSSSSSGGSTGGGSGGGGSWGWISLGFMALAAAQRRSRRRIRRIYR